MTLAKIANRLQQIHGSTNLVRINPLTQLSPNPGGIIGR